MRLDHPQVSQYNDLDIEERHIIYEEAKEWMWDKFLLGEITRQQACDCLKLAYDERFGWTIWPDDIIVNVWEMDMVGILGKEGICPSFKQENKKIA